MGDVSLRHFGVLGGRTSMHQAPHLSRSSLYELPRHLFDDWEMGMELNNVYRIDIACVGPKMRQQSSSFIRFEYSAVQNNTKRVNAAERSITKFRACKVDIDEERLIKICLDKFTFGEVDALEQRSSEGRIVTKRGLKIAVGELGIREVHSRQICVPVLSYEPDAK
jgi:hypothetical protein